MFQTYLNNKVQTVRHNDVSPVWLALRVGGCWSRAGTRERKEEKKLNHHQLAGRAGSRTMTFNRRKPKQIFYKIAERTKSVTASSRR